MSERMPEKNVMKDARGYVRKGCQKVYLKKNGRKFRPECQKICQKEYQKDRQKIRQKKMSEDMSDKNVRRYDKKCQ